MEMFKKVNYELCCLSFLYRELRRFSNNALQRLWLNLVKLQLFINQKCSTVKGDSADWAYEMPRDQSVCRVGFCLYGMKPLSNCVDLKETLMSLNSLKFLMKCPEMCLRFQQMWYVNVCCLNQSYGLRKCAPACGLRKCAPVWTNVVTT